MIAYLIIFLRSNQSDGRCSMSTMTANGGFLRKRTTNVTWLWMSLTQNVQLATRTVSLKLWYCWSLHDLSSTKTVCARSMEKLVFGQLQKRPKPNNPVGTGQRVQSSWNLSQWKGKGTGSFLSMKYFLQYEGSFLERIGMSLSNRMAQKHISGITTNFFGCGCKGNMEHNHTNPTGTVAGP